MSQDNWSAQSAVTSVESPRARRYLPVAFLVIEPANNTLCVESTTARTLTIEDKEPGMTMITVNRDQSLLICGLRIAVMILILIGIAIYFIWKKKKYEKAEGSAVPEEMDYDNSVVMVQMRSSASEL
ncbi:uncharacterized protein AB9X84_010392 isoform 1-T5 [Acanthopagrus schlegelii]